MKISGKIIDIHKRKIFSGVITVEDGVVVAVEESGDVPERYIMPGLVDAHVHVESSMVTPSHFAVAAVRHGTVAVVSDPHEIANVLGVEGVRFMKDDAGKVPLRFVFGAPSCVPATPFENSGAVIGPDETEKLFSKSVVSYLAEMMNFPGVISGADDIVEKINIAKKYGAVIDGHAPGLSGKELLKYVEAGISTDHECSDINEAREKAGRGMNILIREGSAAKNLKALAPLFDCCPEKVMLCSDDLHPENLEKGHINILIRKLLEMGYDLFDVIRAATSNPVNHYSIDSGMLRTGDSADFIIVSSPHEMKVIQTWIKGKCVYDGERTLFQPAAVSKVNNFNCSHISDRDILVRNEGPRYKIIVARNGELLTGQDVEFTGKDNYVAGDIGRDILKIIVKDRYHDSPPATGFVRGFGLKMGAFATSVAHDSHNIIAVGATDSEIVRAVNMVVDAGGGMSVVAEDESLIVKLPVGGIMSDMPVSAIARSYQRLSEKVKSLGCKMDAPYMTLSFMALLVIPQLKISDRGLFDVNRFSPTDLFFQ